MPWPAKRQFAAGNRLRGLQAEVLIGLGLVMAMATLVLVGAGFRLQDAQLAQLRTLAARQLVDEARVPGALMPGPAGSIWWRLGPGGSVVSWDGAQEIDAETLDLAEAAQRAGEPLLQVGAPWEPLRFAVPDANQGVSAMFLAPAAGLPLIGGLALGVVTVLTVFGASVLRGRVVGPLQRLAAGVTAAGCDLEVQLPEEGVRETAEVARAFNGMAQDLMGRTRALEKAVEDLRESNSNLRAARDGLDRAERLAAVGHLASGVAHEVGNPVGALLAFLDLLGREPGLSEGGRAHLANAQRQGERVRAILRELLDFSRPAQGEPSGVDLAELARGTLELVRPQRRYAGIEFHLDVAPEMPRAWVDGSAVSQALLNLVLNAADAVKEGGGSRVTVRVRPGAVRLREGEDASAAAGRRRFEGVELSVEDDGPGVPEELQERIFDPFFTTKEPGHGTGLGLSNALRVAERQGGQLDIEGAGRSGAHFVMRLPAISGRDMQVASRSPSETR